MKIRFDDKLSIPSSRRIQDTGQMIAECAIARTGVLKYQAGELGGLFADRDPSEIIRVAQLSDDLFSEETLEKFRSAPITIGHPLEDVDTVNMKELGKGTLEGKPYQEGDHLAASLVLSDAEAIELVNSGVTELSVRAYYTLHRVDDSMTHDAVRVIQSVNHVAIVERGRAGITCRISDGEDGEVEEIQEAEIHIVEDVVPVVEPEEPVVEDTRLSDAMSEIEVLKAKLDDALAKIPSQEEIDARVETRLDFITTIRSLSDMDIKGKTELEVKREIVIKETGLTLSDATPEYIEARFQILLEDAKPEVETPMSTVLRQAATVVLSDKQKVPQKSLAELARERMINLHNHKL